MKERIARWILVYTAIGPSKRWRQVIVLVVCVIFGSLLGILNAPLWAGFVIVPLLVLFLLPWVMLAEVD